MNLKPISNLFNCPIQFKAMITIIIIAIVIRFLPTFTQHVSNSSTMDALALFCGVYFTRKMVAYMVALSCLLLSDILLNFMLMGKWIFFYPGCCWQYTSYLVIIF